MDSYNELIESLRSMEPMVCSTAADAIEALQSRVAELESRLEISPLHNVDGIMARDATIKLQDERIAELEAERAEREKQKPVTTVENRYNADGKSCHITDDLPAGMPLYAATPVAAPVRLTDEQAEKVDEAIREALGDAYDCLRVWNAWSYGTMGPDDFSQVAEDSDRVAEIRNAAAVALGFKLEGEQ